MTTVFQSGDVPTVQLVLDRFNNSLDDDTRELAVNYAIQSGNVEVLELTLRVLGLTLESDYIPLTSAAISKNSEMIT